MDYICVKELSQKWDISCRMINYYCYGGRIKGAIKIANRWLIPKNADRPWDKRRCLNSSMIQNTSFYQESVLGFTNCSDNSSNPKDNNMVTSETERFKLGKTILSLNDSKIKNTFDILSYFANEFHGHLSVNFIHKSYLCLLNFSLECYLIDCKDKMLKAKFIRALQNSATFSITEKRDKEFAIDISLKLSHKSKHEINDLEIFLK